MLVVDTIFELDKFLKESVSAVTLEHGETSDVTFMTLNLPDVS